MERERKPERKPELDLLPCRYPNILLKPTQLAPPFEAEAYYRRERITVKLSDFQNSWVLLFFYASDFTFVWPTELAAVAARYEAFKKLGVQVLAISTDSVYAHKVFAEISPSARLVQYPLLSDRSHEISRKYGVLREELGFTFRATFIIAPGGEIKYTCLYPPEVGRNVEEILRVIQGLQFEEATGLGVPAGWQPGDPGIKRDFNLVGSI